MTMTSAKCHGCGKEFTSKNQLFRHLKTSARACLSPEDYAAFAARVFASAREKIGVLYGYSPGGGGRGGINGGEDAARRVAAAIDDVSRGGAPAGRPDAAAVRVNRSYGAVSRESPAVAQDPGTGAITEMLTLSARPLSVGDGAREEGRAAADYSDDELQSAWVAAVNGALERGLARGQPTDADGEPGAIRVFGRLPIAQKKFNAETDVTHRRVDYCFPAELLHAVPGGAPTATTAVQLGPASLDDFCAALPSFLPGHRPDAAGADCRPSDATLAYFAALKKLMKRLTTQVSLHCSWINRPN